MSDQGRGRAVWRRLFRFLVLGVVSLGVAVVVLAIIAPGMLQTVRYEITGDGIGAPSETSPLPPLPGGAGDPVRFAVVGDVGTGGDEERATAAAADEVEGDDDYEALLMLGDNSYPDGDPDALGRTVFEPFAGVLDGDTELLAVLGNHDVREGHGDEHAEQIGMPGRWYSTLLGDVLVVSLDSTQPDNAEQRAWLESELRESDARWKIAMLHHPLYSGGYHGSDSEVQEAFEDLFVAHGVQLVLAGHDHDYQRSRPIDGVTHVVSGGAAKLRSASRADFTEVAWSTYHFLDIAVWPDELQLRAVDQDGRMFDSVTLTSE